MNWIPGWIAKLIGTFAVEPIKTINMPEIIGQLAEPVQIIPALPEKLPVLTVTEQQWVDTTQLVIDGVEGGYYDRWMKKNFNAESQRKLGDSGETLFGVDRDNGKALAKYPEWGQLWALVDKAKKERPAEWTYNKRGGIYEKQLKELVAKLMYKWFQYLSGKYIAISAMDEIANDKRLLFHLSYGCWNGEGFFQNYSNALNEAIQKFEGNKEAIFNEAFKERLFAFKYKIVNGKKVKTSTPNEIIRQQGRNVLQLFKKYKITG